MADTSRRNLRRGRWRSNWKNLPVDLLKAILPYLPISALCHGRAVCKRWGELISNMKFVYSSLEFPLPEEYVLIGGRRDAVIAREKLVLADIAKNRFIMVDDWFLTDRMMWKYGITKLLRKFRGTRTLAADGGLFLVAYCPDLQEGTELYVHNPIQKIIKPTPCPHFSYYWQYASQGCCKCARAVMATDKMTMQYEIFLFEIDIDRHGVYHY